MTPSDTPSNSPTTSPTLPTSNPTYIPTSIPSALPCYNNHECFTYPSLTQSDGYFDITCYGYYSCGYVGIITNNIIECFGSFGCYNSFTVNVESVDNIIDTSINAYGLKCYGLLSCSEIDRIEPNNIINCGGESSCLGSGIDITSDESALILYCGGVKSCSETFIFSETLIEFSGYLSNQNSEIACFENGGELIYIGVNSGKGM